MPTVTAPASQPTLDASVCPPPQVESKEALTFLEQNGYVVIKGVLAPDEIATAKDLCWKFLEHGFGSRRGDVTTWCDVTTSFDTP